MSSNNPLSNIPPLGPPSGMAPAGGQSKFKPIDPMKVLRQHVLLLIVTVIVAAMIGVGTWFALDRYMPKWTSVAQLTVNKGLPSANTAQTPEVKIQDLEPEILNNVQAIRSEELLGQLLNNNAVKQTAWYQQFNGDDQEAIRDLQDHTLSANHQSKTTLIRLSVSTDSGSDAQTILRELITVYLRRVDDRTQQQDIKDRRAFQEQKDQAANRIASLKAEIERFMELHKLGSTTTQGNETTLQLNIKTQYQSELERYISSAASNYQSLLDRQKENNFEPSAPDIVLIENSQEMIGIDSQIRLMEVQREALIQRGIPENNPTVRRLDSEIRALQQKRDVEFDSQARQRFNANLEQAAMAVEQFRAEMVEVQKQIGELNARRQDFLRRLQELDAMNRDLAAQEEIRDTAEKLLYELNTRISRTVSVNLYTTPTKAEKTFPKIEIVAPGVTILIIGLVVGGIFLRELLDQRLKGPGDVKSLPDTTMLGMIPDAGEDARSKAGVERVVELESAGLLAESFRQVRTAVLSKMDRRGYKTLMLVGVKPKAGVSAVTQNLGASMSRSGRRVLVLDVNFRRPDQAKLFGVSSERGLADLLTGKLTMDQADQAICQTPDSSLYVMPAGQKQALTPELLEGPQFRELLSRLEASFDTILIDAPPAVLASEAKLLAKHVDAIALVCRAMQDTRGMLQKVLSDLDGQRADILGVILNGVKASAGGYMRKNFKEFYRYRSTETSADSRQPARAATKPAATSPQANGNGTNGHYTNEVPAGPPEPEDLDFDFENPEEDDR